MDSEAKKIAAFLAESVPPTSMSKGPARDRWLDWSRRAAEFGSDAPAAFMRALAEGDYNAQYAALLALRHYGYEAWAQGYWEEVVYKVRSVDESEWRYIEPKIKNPKPTHLT